MIILIFCKHVEYIKNLIQRWNCACMYIYNRKLFYGATVTNIILFVIWTTIILHDIWQEKSWVVWTVVLQQMCCTHNSCLIKAPIVHTSTLGVSFIHSLRESRSEGLDWIPTTRPSISLFSLLFLSILA